VDQDAGRVDLVISIAADVWSAIDDKD
jgi:hypothetical protein